MCFSFHERQDGLLPLLFDSSLVSLLFVLRTDNNLDHPQCQAEESKEICMENVTD